MSTVPTKTKENMYMPPPSTTATPVAAPPALLPATVPPLLALPPPPPPHTATSTAVRLNAPIFTAQPPQNAPAIFPNNQAPPIIMPMFDASRPPPSLPSNVQNNISQSQKRPADLCEAGPSKSRKQDGSKVDSLCENCVQRELRIAVYRQEMEKLHREEQLQRLILNKKTEEYENGRLLLRAVVNSDWYRILDEFIEGTSRVPRDILLELMEYVIGTPDNGLDSVHSSLNVQETIFQSLSSITRQSVETNYTNSIAQTYSNLITEGVEAPVPSTNQYPLLGAATRGYPVPGGESTEGPPSNATTAAVPAPGFMPYQPTIPPPAVRPYYAQPYPSSPNVPNSGPYNSPARTGAAPSVPAPAPAPAQAPVPVRPPVTTPAPVATQNGQTYHFLGRNSARPPFYPPFQ